MDPESEAFILDQVPKIARLGGVVTARDVCRNVWQFRRAGNALLTLLVQRGIGRWEVRRPGAKGGRPTRVFVLNPGSGGPPANEAKPEAEVSSGQPVDQAASTVQ